MFLRPRTAIRSAEDGTSPAELLDSFAAMATVGAMLSVSPFFWCPPLWVLSLLTSVPEPSKTPRAEVEQQRAAPEKAPGPTVGEPPAIAAPAPAARPATSRRRDAERRRAERLAQRLR